MIQPIRFAALCLATLACAPAAAQRRSSKPPKLEHFTTETVRFESAALEREVEYRVFLPAGYHDKDAADTRYPLVVWLHGMWEDHDRFFERGGAAVLDAMRGKGEIPELVLVCPNGDKASFYINGVAPKSAYEDLIVDDLLSHCEATYRLEPGRASRAITGVSMGGYGALKIAFTHPEAFGVVAAHSAALLPRDPDDLEKAFPWLRKYGGAQKALGAIFGPEIDRETWRAENVLEIAAGLDPEDLDGLKIYRDCGDADSYGFFAPNLELSKILDEREIPHTWRPVEGGEHGWRRGYNAAALPESLRFVASAFTVRRATSGLSGLFGAPAGAAENPERK